MKKPAKNTIRIELTEEQKKKVRDELGHDVDAVELRVEEHLEDRVAPSSIGTFL
jgi:hypothetical protein